MTNPERRSNLADFRLSLGGEDLRGDLDVDQVDLPDITAKVRPRLRSLTLTEKRGGDADQLDLVLDDSDGLLALPAKGAIIRLALGWARGTDVEVGLIDKGRFTVAEVGWSGEPDQIRITARSADMARDLRVRRERGWRGTTLGAIARTVAAANKLEPRIAPSLDGIAVPALVQHQQSDMALLRRLGRDHDAVATIKDRKLILAPIGRGTSTSGRPLPAVTITRVDGSGPDYREVDRASASGVEARWHDKGSGDRKTVAVGSADGAGSKKPHRLRRIYHSESDARSAATAEAGRRRRAEAEFTFTLALGRPELYPERAVTLSGFKPRIDAQTWLIAELTHTLDPQGGLGTRLKLETKG